MIEAVTIAGRRGLLSEANSGLRVFYGLVGPEDEGRLRRGVGELSPNSRYLRFFSPGDQLSEEQIQRFTNPDQVDHIAWGALAADEPGMPGLGLGRMVRVAENHASAELAVAVIDRAQGQGVGTMLLALLCATARRTGISELRALVLPENRLVLQWFTRLGGQISSDDIASDVRLPVPLQGARAEAPLLARFVDTVDSITSLLPQICARW